MALPAIEDQVIDLREALNEFIRVTQNQYLGLLQAQLQTERKLERLCQEVIDFKDEMKAFKDEMLEFKDEMKDFKDEMKAFKDEMLEFKNEMKAFKDEMLEFKDEMKDFKDEMKAFKDEMLEFKNEMKDFKGEMQQFKDDTVLDRKRMNKQWGDLANRLGTVVEDIVAPNIEGIARRYFGCTELDDLMVRYRKRNPLDRTQRREFDVIALWENNVLLNETKSMARMDDVRTFSEFLQSGAFFDYFPEYRGKTLIPIFSSFYLSAEIVESLTRTGIYAMAMSDDSMDLLNFDSLANRF